MKKLVRDRIPEIIEANGEQPSFYRADAEEYAAALREKLAEECRELQTAQSREEVMAEAADVWEVVEAILEQAGVDKVEAVAYKEKKKVARGGFAIGYILEMAARD